ncbi:prelamin-A/C-like [Ptychodera flava]|uniref:prelamin-A/C-like n=1 Tax=Ptychodera flava TaxID=63121 RepID=UPI00396A2D1D
MTPEKSEETPSEPKPEVETKTVVDGEDTATPEKSEETPSEPKPEDETKDDQDKETTEEGEDTGTPEKSEETPNEPKPEDETKTVVDGEDTATPEKSEETPSEPKPEDETKDDQDKETTEEGEDTGTPEKSEETPNEPKSEDETKTVVDGEDTATPEKSEETPSEPKPEDETKTVVDGEDTATPEKSEETPSEPKPEDETKTVVDGEDTATPEKSEETPSEPKPEDETKTVVDGEDTATPEKSEETPSEPKPEDETKTVVDGEDTATPEKSEETPKEPKPEDETKTVVDGEDTATPEKSEETPSEPKPEDDTKDDQAVETAEGGGIEKAPVDESQESKSKEEEIMVKTAAGVLGVPFKEQPVMDVEDKAVTAQTKTTDVEGSVTVTSKTEDVLTAQIEEQKPSDDQSKDDRHPQTQIHLVRHYERELQSLNERLACYVDVVRKIETGGGNVRKVWTALNASEENVIASIGDLKIEYGKSLSSIEELFKKVEETRTFKERETYDVNEKNRELRQRLSKLEAELSERTVELKQASIEKEQLHEDLSTKSHELDKVRADIDAERELRQKIEENYNMEFLLQNQFETQMKEIKMIKKEMIEDIIKGDKQGAEEERMKLKATLKKWSEYYQNQLQKYKENFEIKYEKEIQRLKRELEADRNQLIKTDYELRVNLVKTGELDSQLKSVRAKSTVMEEEIRELEERRKELIIQSEQMAAVIKERDEEIRQLKMKADITSQDQTDSVSDSDRILLDKEIDKFRKLLEIEEERLNLGEDQRKEMGEIDSPTQLIKIEVDESKKFLKLENISGEDQSLGGFELKRKKGEQEFSYRFKSGQVLKAGSTLTLWTKGQREEEETETDLKIEDVDDFSDDESDTLLHDVQGQVKSVRYSKKSSSVTVSS